MAVPAQRQLKVIVGLDGISKPLLSTTAVGPADLLALVTTASASVLMGSDGLPSILVVQLSPAPATPDVPVPDPVPVASPSFKLITEDGRVLTTEDGVPLVLPDDLNGP